MPHDIRGDRLRDADAVHPNRNPAAEERRIIIGEPSAAPKLPDDLAKLGVDWIDISSEEWREYERGGGMFLRIENPRWLYVSPTKNHYVVDADGVVTVVHADLTRPILRWKADPIIDWLPKT